MSRLFSFEPYGVVLTSKLIRRVCFSVLLDMDMAFAMDSESVVTCFLRFGTYFFQQIDITSGVNFG